MMWISGAVLLIGIAVFLGIYFAGSAQDVHPSSNAANVVSKGTVDSNPLDVSAQKVPASPAARSVARLFLETAVARKNMPLAYTLVGPWLKGVPRAQWIKGNNPVTYFPGKNLKTASLVTKSSTKNALLLEVGPLVVGKGHKIGGLPSLAFTMEVDRLHGKWLVNYFMPDYSFKRLATDSAGSGGN
jgi:hypothetical protein